MPGTTPSPSPFTAPGRLQRGEDAARPPGQRHIPEVSFSPKILITYGRMVTAAFGLVAIWLDPTHPSGEVGNVQMVLAAYLAFSILIFAISTYWRGSPRLAPSVTHAIDIVALSLLVLYSEELDSPFFVFFSFTLITAAMQWGMGGIFATAMALQLLLAASALADLQDSDSELNILIMRSAFCWVSAVMLGYFATYRERMRRRLAALAGWQPEGPMVDDGAAFSHSLDGALEILGASRIIVCWKEIGAATGHCIVRRKGVDEPARAVEGAALAKAGAIDDLQATSDHPALAPILRALDDGPAGKAEGERGAQPRPICVTRLLSERHEGLVIVIDGSGEPDQIAALAHILALRIAAHLAQLAAAGEQAEAAGLREREALARDLHDGVLQHLTAAALHLKVARADPAGGPQRLATVAAILLDQQQQIRQFVEGARAVPALHNEPVGGHLERLARMLGQHWGCQFAVRVTPETLQLDNAMVAELGLLFSEATANAVRHGQARSIRWTVSLEKRSLTLTVEDDGCGLTGSAEWQAFPQSLSARVAKLGGTLDIASSAAGVLVKIRIILRRARP